VIVLVHPKRGFWTEITYPDMDAFRAEQRDARRQPDRVAAILADEELLFDRSKTRLALAEEHASTLPPR
jgi:hypothetical protein